MSSSNVENLTPNVLRKISKELAELVSSPPEGIKIIPNEEDVSDIQAIIDGPAGTPYQNGSFRVKLILGKSFPLQPPKGYFQTKIFHPNVSRNGEICVNTLKKDWNKNLGIKHILLVIKCLLIVPNAESALNEDAAKLLLEDYNEYYRRAKMITEIHATKRLQQQQQHQQTMNNNNCTIINDNNDDDNLLTNKSNNQSAASNNNTNNYNDQSSTNNNKTKSTTNNEMMPLLKKRQTNINDNQNQNINSQQLKNRSNNPTKSSMQNNHKRTLKRL